ncbi:uncharacterized protein LOC102354009 isoform X2 [Latimeria chalumnae]|uniref:uncharacterized protein LOC102354009 isoform X2 n=1 Tax=Latimeria chalumnae TaxID=7897 RepID=UPI00313B783D
MLLASPRRLRSHRPLVSPGLFSPGNPTIPLPQRDTPKKEHLIQFHQAVLTPFLEVRYLRRIPLHIFLSGEPFQEIRRKGVLRRVRTVLVENQR